MLIITQNDMQKAVSCDGMVNAIEEAYALFTEGRCVTKDRFTISSGGNTVLYMPCIAGGYFSTKILCEWPANPAKGLPYLDGMVMLCNETNGQIDALMAGSALTAWRTGAVGAVALKHLSPPDVKNIGLIGCGVQGFHQLWYAAQIRPVQTFYLYNHGNKDLAPFIARLEAALAPKRLRCVVCKDAESLLAASEVVITTTQAESPVLPNDAARLRGKLFIAIGSWKPQMREIPEAIWSCVDEVFIELPFACEESGDLSQPLASGALSMDKVRYLGEYLRDKKNGKTEALKETRYFKSVGMGVFDALVARQMLKDAAKSGLGQTVAW
jgi:ornithine cyclodeaminase/alanine dehydrogenase-like protein (mu-crystallin family)